MKKLFLCTCFVCVISSLFYSCSNDEIVSSADNSTLSMSITSRDVSLDAAADDIDNTIIINTTEDFMAMFPPIRKNDMGVIPFSNANREYRLLQSGNFKRYKERGYTDYVSSGIKKVFFTEAGAAVFGLHQGVYFAEFFTVKKIIKIPAGAYPVSIPNGCNGFSPNGKDMELGYSGEILGSSFIMVSNVTCLRYNMIGQTFNRWRPVQMNELVWEYGLISM